MAFCLACGIPRLNRTNCGNINFTKLTRISAWIQICYRKTIPGAAGAGVWTTDCHFIIMFCFLSASLYKPRLVFLVCKVPLTIQALPTNYHAPASRDHKFLSRVSRGCGWSSHRDWVNYNILWKKDTFILGKSVSRIKINIWRATLMNQWLKIL